MKRGLLLVMWSSGIGYSAAIAKSLTVSHSRFGKLRHGGFVAVLGEEEIDQEGGDGGGEHDDCHGAGGAVEEGADEPGAAAAD